MALCEALHSTKMKLICPRGTNKGCSLRSQSSNQRKPTNSPMENQRNAWHCSKTASWQNSHLQKQKSSRMDLTGSGTSASPMQSTSFQRSLSLNLSNYLTCKPQAHSLSKLWHIANEQS